MERTMLTQTETRPAARDVLKNWPIEATVPKPSTDVSAAEILKHEQATTPIGQVKVTDHPPDLESVVRQPVRTGVEALQPTGQSWKQPIGR